MAECTEESKILNDDTKADEGVVLHGSAIGLKNCSSEENLKTESTVMEPESTQSTSKRTDEVGQSAESLIEENFAGTTSDDENLYKDMQGLKLDMKNVTEKLMSNDLDCLLYSQDGGCAYWTQSEDNIGFFQGYSEETDENIDNIYETLEEKFPELEKLCKESLKQALERSYSRGDTSSRNFVEEDPEPQEMLQISSVEDFSSKQIKPAGIDPDVLITNVQPSALQIPEIIKTALKEEEPVQFNKNSCNKEISPSAEGDIDRNAQSGQQYWPQWIGTAIILHVCVSVSLPSDEDSNVLHIGGIFPIAGEGGWQGGQACMPAANLALEDVNDRKDLLPGYVLKLHSNDSECEPGLGASVMYNLLYNQPQKLMLLAGCSTVCTTVAEAAKMWNLVVLCYGASSPALSDRNRFPTLFRTHPSATVHNPTRIKLMKKFGWSRVAILQQAEEVFISTVEDLETRCMEANIEIVTRQSFLSDPTDAVRNLRRQDARVIVGLFYVVAARRVLCEIYKQKLYGKSYTWFFIGWYEDNWFKVISEKDVTDSCTVEQMKEAAEGHLTTEALMWNQNKNERTISGMTAEDFRKRLNGVLRSEGYSIDNGRYPEGYQEAPLAYDAVWSVALAFNKTMDRLHKYGKSLKEFNYNNKEIADDIYSAINSTQFLGISGFVAFSSQGDRIALTQIEQVINGSYVVLGYYDTQADNLTWFDREVWHGGKVPQDRTIVRKVLRTVSLPLFICMCVISSIGILIAIGLVAFNIWNSHRRVIQSSHPVCNTIMLFGIVVCLIAVFLLGLDGRFVSPGAYPAICQTRAWLLSTGFTLSFGAMFSKVWRVHRLTTKAKSDPKVRIKKVEPWKLYSMVSGLLVVDFVVMIAWQLHDPLQRKIESFPLEDPELLNDDSKIRPELEHCESHNNSVWLAVICAYKGLVLIFGLFLAYETRSVKVKQINDSRYVGMSIYNVVILCLITAPVTMVIASQQDASYAFVALAIVFCCFLSMALIFVPKVIEVIRHPKDKAESKYNPDAGVSKEDEERYQKLLNENEELQRLIAQKEEKIKLLKERLAEKEAGKGDLAPSTITQGKDTLIVADFITDAGTSDSAFGAGISIYTRSSRCSQSDVEFSDSYL